jgi:hypothetical protein
MRIALGTFACTGISSQLGVDPATGALAALLHYAGKLKSGREPIEVTVPPFGRNQAPQDPEVALDLTVDPETEAVLQREAARQGTTISQLAVHSVLAYLAELDLLGGAVPPSGGRPRRLDA